MLSHSDTSIRRVYVEKRRGFDVEAQNLKAEVAEFLGPQHPDLISLSCLRILQRYDVAHLGEEDFEKAIPLVFSEPQCDMVHRCVDVPLESGAVSFAVEYLAGQYDQRADSAEQCVELAVGVRPKVRTARVYVLSISSGSLSPEALKEVKSYLINPVDSREATLELPETLDSPETLVPPVPTLDGFSSAQDRMLESLAGEYGFAMSLEDLRFCRDFFYSIKRDPTLAELRVLDTYWSDHCRHSTFTTALEHIEIEEGPDALSLRDALAIYEKIRQEVYGSEGVVERKKTLMDLAVIGSKALRKRGLAADLEDSKEINACSVRIRARFADGKTEPWLLMFKNETHNHPTEIEPFGGAATCLGGAIRDPLSGRAFVHQAMRITGGGDPRVPLSETLPGKLPQIKIAREAAAGYSSYGNQIGLATGQVAEFYHEGFLAKRMELGAVIAAVPEAWVRREEPQPGDVILLLGGKTGRDGIGGATGSSKIHTDESVREAGAEVQKGNPVEERKIQRLFRNTLATRLIKRCNDFGAGGVAVAVGELARGLDIDLDAVPKKYAGLDGVELAISESQERMAVVVAPEDEADFIRLAAEENLTAVRIARITAEDEEPEGSTSSDKARLRMSWRGQVIVDLPRSFLDTNGAFRSTKVRITPDSVKPEAAQWVKEANSSPSYLLDQLERTLASLPAASRRGLQERFDGSIGAASVLFPFGGMEQGTPECGMAALLPSLEKESYTASLMSFGYDPELACESPYRGAKGAIKEALAKFTCLGGKPWTARLSLQEYFERMENPEAWGKPLAALLGALEAQLALDVPAIGGKDSMSGSYRDPAKGIDLAVPPTLVAFAAGITDAGRVRSGALSGQGGNPILLLGAYKPGKTAEGEWQNFRTAMDALTELTEQGFVKAAYPVQSSGIAATLAIMAFGNMTGVELDVESLYLVKKGKHQGTVLIELEEKNYRNLKPGPWTLVARTLEIPVFRMLSENEEKKGEASSEAAESPLSILRRAYEYPLCRVYPQTTSGLTAAEEAENNAALEIPIHRGSQVGAQGFRSQGAPGLLKGAKPLVILPAFPGTNCEWDMERAFRRAGAETRVLVFRNRDRQDVLDSTLELATAIGGAQILALSGGFSAGDEPEGSGKFIAAALRAQAVRAAIMDLLDRRDGLILGICNGFQALIKTGLLPYGEFRDADESMPTLTYNALGRHVSRMVHTKIMSDKSPWMARDGAEAIHVIPVSHGEGRLAIRDELAKELIRAGQIATCYVDPEGRPTMAEPYNPNGSAYAVEGLLSPDGRVLGKMGHSERTGDHVHINIPGDKVQRIFQAGVEYFKG